MRLLRRVTPRNDKTLAVVFGFIRPETGLMNQTPTFAQTSFPHIPPVPKRYMLYAPRYSLLYTKYYILYTVYNTVYIHNLPGD
jgi:hypothetical protein